MSLLIFPASFTLTARYSQRAPVAAPVEVQNVARFVTIARNRSRPRRDPDEPRYKGRPCEPVQQPPPPPPKVGVVGATSIRSRGVMKSGRCQHHRFCVLHVPLRPGHQCRCCVLERPGRRDGEKVREGCRPGDLSDRKPNTSPALEQRHGTFPSRSSRARAWQRPRRKAQADRD